MEKLFHRSEENIKKMLVLIIYDIVDNKRRTKLANYLCGYGFRIQKSSFEAVLDIRQYKAMMRGLTVYINENEDSIRIYKIIGYSGVTVVGQKQDYLCEEVIIV